MDVNGKWWNQPNCVAARRPHPALRGVVSAYIAYEERLLTPVQRRMIAAVAPVLLIDFGDVRRHIPLGSGERGEEVGTCPILTVGSPFTLEMYGRDHGVAVLFTPPGAFALFGTPISALARNWISWGDLIGDRVAELLRERIYHSKDWSNRFDLLDNTLLKMVSSRSWPSPCGRAWRELEVTTGRITIEALAKRSHMSRRQLERVFQKEVGCTPKRAASVLRFREAFKLIGLRADMSLAEIANAVGYTDQAHLSREVVKLGGATPRTVRRDHQLSAREVGGWEENPLRVR
ncbi:helix-turn-helix domain-containing protein [Streptomyces roseoverticillatus]|uniref:Helix-turn-helix domain-containing protein n=1 Tax=Streptomyces roseoverticillatus TaxID=66429 RepID=A0ABV3J3K6_9ACTN